MKSKNTEFKITEYKRKKKPLQKQVTEVGADMSVIPVHVRELNPPVKN